MAKPPHVTPRDRAAWTAWLEKHHASKQEVFLVFYRKATGKPTLTYADAVEEALCFGWIDGVKHKLDDERYTYRFTPRRAGSVWSAINKERIAALEAAGKIRPAGRAAIEAARASGSWAKQQVSPANVTAMPAELSAALRAAPRAQAAFAKLPPSHQRQWQAYVQQAKQAETRERRAAKAVEMLVKGTADPRKL
jgi:uncharacterized protein YdeI (YjbR/CyaY-like superfamily)